MTRKIYRTAQGKMVDLGALQLQNENVRAVGNMGVNARGDLLDSQNRPIGTRNKQVAKQYNRQTSTPTQPATSQKKQAAPQSSPVVDIPAPPEDFEDDFVKETAPKVVDSAPGGGLAAAIAKARQIKQEPMKPAKETTKDQGVKKF